MPAPPPSRASVTVSIAADGSLVYSVSGNGTAGSGKQKVRRGTQVEWISPSGSTGGALGVVFATPSPFASGDTVLVAAQNVSTGFETTISGGSFKYTAVVARPGDSLLHIEDPILEVSDDDHGNAKKSKKKAAKKSAPKKKK